MWQRCRVLVAVATESPQQDDVCALIEALSEHLRPLSPPEFQFGLTLDEMTEPETTVFVARDPSGRAVGCGALKRHADDFGEVKRMFTRPEARGAGVGSSVLEAIVSYARAQGLRRLLLETGVGPGFACAWRLYLRTGFMRRGPYLDYPDSEWSAYFERDLDAPREKKSDRPLTS